MSERPIIRRLCDYADCDMEAYRACQVCEQDRCPTHLLNFADNVWGLGGRNIVVCVDCFGNAFPSIDLEPVARSMPGIGTLPFTGQ